MNRRSIIAALTILLAACAPAAQAPGQSGGAPAASTAPKLLRVGINQGEEPSADSGGIAYYNNEVGYMLHASLTMWDTTTNQLAPRIAQRVPTVENGDWKVNPDGRMEVTWKVRPNVVWHDGTSLTAEDFVFGFNLTMDPELFARGTATLRLIDQITAPDAETLVIRWKELYIFANEIGRGTIVPLPKHLLSPLYDSTSKQNLAAHPYWTSQFMGVGPYRLSDWLPGSYMEMRAFDQYFEGKPKIDRISVKYFGDVNALIVSIIAGEIDLVPVGSLKTEEAHVLKQQWEAAGAGSVIQSHTRLRVGDWQFREPTAPWAQDARVRMALVKLIDRQAMVETIHNGLSAVWDIPLPSENPAARLAQQRGLPNLTFDPPQAHRLLAEAGLTRGADGMYRTASGAPFAIELLAQSDIKTNVQELLAMADQWKTGGLDATTTFVSGSTDWREAAAKVPGVYVGGTNPAYSTFRSYISSEISTQANRWRASNRAGYSNPSYDQLVARLYSTIDGGQRDQLAADLVKLSLDQVVFHPLTYSSDIAAVRKNVTGVTGVVAEQRVTPWNIHAWDMHN